MSDLGGFHALDNGFEGQSFRPGQEAFLLTPDGNVLIGGIAEVARADDNSGDWFDAELVVGVRGSSCN